MLLSKILIVLNIVGVALLQLKKRGESSRNDFHGHRVFRFKATTLTCRNTMNSRTSDSVLSNSISECSIRFKMVQAG